MTDDRPSEMLRQWHPMTSAPLNAYGEAFGPTVQIWCDADALPWPAYYEPSHDWKHGDVGPAWVIPDQDPAIAPEDAVAWAWITPPEGQEGCSTRYNPKTGHIRRTTMKTRDEAIRDLSARSEEQCEALAEKMTAVIDEMDAEGEPEWDTLRGIAKDSDGRAMLVFKPDGSTKRTPRTIVYVDAILALAKLLNGEVQVEVGVQDE